MSTEQGAAVTIDVKALGEEGEFEGYASVFGHLDLGGDIVLPGAFEKSIKARGARGVRMLWQHDPAKPIGVWTDLGEDRRGLKAKGRFLLSTAGGKEAHTWAKEGAADGLSIGYRTVKASFDKSGARQIAEADLWEISLVTFPMNPKATISAVKGGLEIPSRKEMEALLRKEAGLSHAKAAHVAALVRDAILRKGGDQETIEALREGDATDAIANALHEAARSLRL